VLAVETLRTVVLGALEEISTKLPQLERLLHSKSPRRAWFLSAEAKAAMDDMIRKERVDLAEAKRKGWLPIFGASPAPGNLAAIDLVTQVHATLLGLEHEALTRLQVCPINRPDQPATDQLKDSLAGLVAAVDDTKWLADADADLSRLSDQLVRLLEGEGSTQLPSNCPYCGRRTLVAIHTEELIRCARDQQTGRLEQCVCPFPECPCKRSNHRHEWHRSQGGYHTLAELIREADRRRRDST